MATKQTCLMLVSNNPDDSFYLEAMKKLSQEKNFTVIVDDDYQKITSKIDFVFCFNYRKIIPKLYIDEVRNGIYVFHSSDLPAGKGWAPIYHSIMSQAPEHVLTTLKIDKTLDGGEIIAKTYFKKREGENADSLREIDNWMTLETIRTFIADLLKYRLTGKSQAPDDNHRSRRHPEDSQISTEKTIDQVHLMALAVTLSHPLFYYHNNCKYILLIRPEKLEPFKISDFRISLFYEKDPSQ